MQLHYLLVVIVSDVKVMSFIVAVIFAVINYSAIMWVVNNYHIWTEPNSFRTEPKQKKIYSARPYWWVDSWLGKLSSSVNFY